MRLLQAGAAQFLQPAPGEERSCVESPEVPGAPCPSMWSMEGHVPPSYRLFRYALKSSSLMPPLPRSVGGPLQIVGGLKHTCVCVCVRPAIEALLRGRWLSALSEKQTTDRLVLNQHSVALSVVRCRASPWWSPRPHLYREARSQGHLLNLFCARLLLILQLSPTHICHTGVD